MASNLKIAATVADTGNAAIAALFNGGKLRIYEGAQPADTTVAAGTMLAELTFANPAYGASSAGVMAANAITAGTAVATGTATYFRAFKSDGTTPLVDGTVGTSGCDINLSSVDITAGDQVSVSAFPITFPEP